MMLYKSCTIMYVGVSLLCELLQLGICRVCRNHEINELQGLGQSPSMNIAVERAHLACGGLAALVHPPAGEYHIFIRTPDAVDKHAVRALKGCQLALGLRTM